MGGFCETMSVGVVSWAVAEDVFSSFGGFTAWAGILAVEGEAASKFACVVVASSAL
jgi:hypothetical protein